MNEKWDEIWLRSAHNMGVFIKRPHAYTGGQQQKLEDAIHAKTSTVQDKKWCAYHMYIIYISQSSDWLEKI